MLSLQCPRVATLIFNNITRTGKYPDQWKIEYGVPIPKTQDIPKNEDEIRVISKTSFMSKVYESFLVDWLMIHIEPYLDSGQCGGLKGLSINHYLLKLLHFVHSEIDQNQPHAVISVLLDLSKAFNRVDHNLIIQDLFDMKCPSWLLKIIFSYLTNRSLIVSYRGATASPQPLPAGSPQGTVLGVIVFIVKVNGLALRPPIPRSIPPPNKQEDKSVNVKYLDDSSSACSINLKKCLIPDPDEREKPLNYHEKNKLILPKANNPLQAHLDEIFTFTQEQNMKINQGKTKLMLFNLTKNWQFPPEMGFEEGEKLECVRQSKILGLVISDDLKWYQNTKYITERALSKIWTIRRLKNLGLTNDFIFDVYTKEIRSILEFGAPVWTGGLMDADSEK